MQTLLKTTRAYGLVKREESRGELGHAYLLLFDDPRNLKAALKTFVKPFFHCTEEERLSRLIDNETFSDCLFFPKDGKKFTVEDAEAITEESTLKPVEGEKKAFVIADFAEATTAAQNKLLKLLEEPPEGVVFLLGATTVYPVLSTVLSRVKTLEIPPFDAREIENCLLRTYADKYAQSEIELCSAACGGKLGGAQDMLEGGAYKALVDEAFSLCLTTAKDLPLLVKKIGDTKRKKELLSLLRMIFRDALVIKSVGAAKISLRSERERLYKAAEKYTLPTLVYAQEAISKAERETFFNANFPQCLEILIASVLTQNERI
ncbi:MAG: hypothetical protein IJX96_01920 [Clostridia bacterium]|nr:hypothetical protein [Clostridia bacterium]